MSEQLDRIEEKVDKLSTDFNDHRVHVEGRITALETKAGLFGMIGGAIGSLIAYLVGR